VFYRARHDNKVTFVQLDGSVPEIDCNAATKNKKSFVFIGV
jgi:prepilin-type processing-associated H-X9-DG protein